MPLRHASTPHATTSPTYAASSRQHRCSTTGCRPSSSRHASGSRRQGSISPKAGRTSPSSGGVLGQIVAANYQSGDPGLMGLSMVLTTQNPTELTGQLNSVRNIMDKQAVVLDRLEATKTLLIVQEREVARAKAEVARQRRAAAAHLVRMQHARGAGRDSRGGGAQARRRPGQGQAPGRPRQAGRPCSAATAAARAQPHLRGPQASRRGGTGRRARPARVGRPAAPRTLQRLLGLPGQRLRHLAVRLAHPPDLRLPLAARRRRLRRLLRAADPRGRRRARSSRRTTSPRGATA